MTDKDIRKVSRQLNKGTYLKSSSIVFAALICCAVFAVIPFLIMKISVFSGLRDTFDSINPYLFPAFFALLLSALTLAEFIILSTVSMGEKAWYSGRLTKKRQCGKRLRFWLKPSRSFKAFRLNALIWVLKLLWTSALLSPALLIFSSVLLLSLNGGIELYLFISLAAGGVLLLITGLIFRFIIVQRYFLAPYLLADDPKLKVVQAVKRSKNLSEGQLFRVIKFKLKFLPTFLLYPLIFPAVFLRPNYKQGCSVVAKELYM